MEDACGENKMMSITANNLTDITSPMFPDDYPNNMVTAMDSMIEAAKKLYSVYGNHLNFEVFLNKTDLLNDDQCAGTFEFTNSNIAGIFIL